MYCLDCFGNRPCFAYWPSISGCPPFVCAHFRKHRPPTHTYSVLHKKQSLTCSCSSNYDNSKLHSLNPYSLSLFSLNPYSPVLSVSPEPLSLLKSHLDASTISPDHLRPGTLSLSLFWTNTDLGCQPLLWVQSFSLKKKNLILCWYGSALVHTAWVTSTSVKLPLMQRQRQTTFTTTAWCRSKNSQACLSPVIYEAKNTTKVTTELLSSWNPYHARMGGNTAFKSAANDVLMTSSGRTTEDIAQSITYNGYYSARPLCVGGASLLNGLKPLESQKKNQESHLSYSYLKWNILGSFIMPCC